MNVSFFFQSIIAGACISMGAAAYMEVGGLGGAILFAFGLITIVTMKLKLFTGFAQYCWKRQHWLLLEIWAGNMIGCALMSMAMLPAGYDCISEGVIAYHLSFGLWHAFFLAMCCGFIMTLSVQNAYKDNWLPLCFGVPTFILCGFPHCIADAFYLMNCSHDFILKHGISHIGIYYCVIVLGNYLGCNIFRLVKGYPLGIGLKNLSAVLIKR
jgi:formate/nitrite transporter FocA (FNT family)